MRCINGLFIYLLTYLLTYILTKSDSFGERTDPQTKKSQSDAYENSIRSPVVTGSQWWGWGGVKAKPNKNI